MVVIGASIKINGPLAVTRRHKHFNREFLVQIITIIHEFIEEGWRERRPVTSSLIDQREGGFLTVSIKYLRSYKFGTIATANPHPESLVIPGISPQKVEGDLGRHCAIQIAPTPARTNRKVPIIAVVMTKPSQVFSIICFHAIDVASIRVLLKVVAKNGCW